VSWTLLIAFWFCMQWVAFVHCVSRRWWWSLGHDEGIWWQHSCTNLRQLSSKLTCDLMVHMWYEWLHVTCLWMLDKKFFLSDTAILCLVCEFFRDNVQKHATIKERGCIRSVSIDGDTTTVQSNRGIRNFRVCVSLKCILLLVLINSLWVTYWLVQKKFVSSRHSFKSPNRVPLPPPTGSQDAYSYSSKSFTKPTSYPQSSSSSPPNPYYATPHTATPATPSSTYDNQVQLHVLWWHISFEFSFS
jgi:hypothetical protein